MRVLVRRDEGREWDRGEICEGAAVQGNLRAAGLAVEWRGMRRGV